MLSRDGIAATVLSQDKIAATVLSWDGIAAIVLSRDGIAAIVLSRDGIAATFRLCCARLRIDNRSFYFDSDPTYHFDRPRSSTNLIKTGWKLGWIRIYYKHMNPTGSRFANFQCIETILVRQNFQRSSSARFRIRTKGLFRKK